MLPAGLYILTEIRESTSMETSPKQPSHRHTSQRHQYSHHYQYTSYRGSESVLWASRGPGKPVEPLVSYSLLISISLSLLTHFSVPAKNLELIISHLIHYRLSSSFRESFQWIPPLSSLSLLYCTYLALKHGSVFFHLPSISLFPFTNLLKKLPYLSSASSPTPCNHWHSKFCLHCDIQNILYQITAI